MAGGEPPFYPINIDQSCRFNDNDSAYLTYTPAGAGTEETFTFSFWIKRGNIGSIQQIINAAAGNELKFTAADKLQFTTASGDLLTTQVFRDTTNWYHIVLAVDDTQAVAADRVNLYVNGSLVSAYDTEDYLDQNEVTEFFKAAQHHIASNEGGTEEFDGYLAEFHSVDGTQEAVTDFGEFKQGVWIPKTYTGAYGTNGFYLKFDNKTLPNYTDKEAALSLNGWNNSGMESLTLNDGFNAITVVNSAGAGSCYPSDDAGSNPLDLGAMAIGEVYRVTCTCTVNSGDLDKNVRVGLYQSGVGVISNWPYLKAGYNELYLTVTTARAASYLYIYTAAADVDFSATGMTFEKMDSDAFGWDSSGNTNHFASVNLIASNDNYLTKADGSTVDTGDQVIDTPTNNYCTLTTLHKTSATDVLSNGGLDSLRNHASWGTACGTFTFNSGKWYAECRVGDITFNLLGVGQPDRDIVQVATYYGDDAFSWALRTNDSTEWLKLTASGSTSLGGTPAVGDIMQIAVDADAGKVWFGVNNTWFASGDPAAGTNESYSGLSGDLNIGVSNYTATAVSQMNFGQHGFTYTLPSGYKALCSANMAKRSMASKEPYKGFDVKLYTGTGAENAQTGLSFQPDFIWFKYRNAAHSHFLFDSVRGATKYLYSDADNAEMTAAETLKSFDTAGFTVGTNVSVNTAAGTYVAWCWKESVDYGFDIVSYTGTGANPRNISHSLGAVPEMYMVKERGGDTGHWRVYHHHALNKTNPEDYQGILNLANAWADDNTMWNDTAPTSSVFTLGSAGDINDTDDTYIAYLWRSIEGYSKVFSYTGNGNADGPFVWCGFRPKFLLMKNASSAGHEWFVYDTDRNTYNPLDDYLLPDLPNAEGSVVSYDFLSNGFKVRTASVKHNTNAHIYMGVAFAEMPFKYSNAR